VTGNNEIKLLTEHENVTQEVLLLIESIVQNTKQIQHAPFYYVVSDLKIISQVYALFTVLKCNLVFVFRSFFHYHFHATCFGNSLPYSGVGPLTISLQFIVKNDV
jgi:hypothetical protein